ncbi:MAG: amino acid ABC transporter permease [Ruminococcaceae bacterium]|nr:amino acid ABC transporter permease [Oscillospiraceae bacterium]
MNFERVLSEALPLLFEGIRLTVVISLVSLVLGVVIGFISCLLSRSKFWIFRFISGFYIWIIRGTPMIVQAFIVYFGMPQLIQEFFDPGFRLTATTAGIITLSLNAGAYLSEIFRGGLSAVSKGQTEAARSLGMTPVHTMFKVVLPQALKVAIPSMVNQFIITVKDTSILSAIGMAEIVNKAKVYVGSSYEFFATYFTVAIFYLIVTSILMLLSNFVEKRLNYERKNNS